MVTHTSGRPVERVFPFCLRPSMNKSSFFAQKLAFLYLFFTRILRLFDGTVPNFPRLLILFEHESWGLVSFLFPSFCFPASPPVDSGL